MIDGSEKRNRQLAFELQNSYICEKRSNVRKLLKRSSYSRCTYFILKCAYLAHASLNSLYIPLSVLPVVEISAAPIIGK